MNGLVIHRFSPSIAAFVVAVGVHVGVTAGLVYMPQSTLKPPQVTGGFEVVDLSAFGAVGTPEPQVKEDQVAEETPTDPEPEPISEPEPIAEPEPEPGPQPMPKPEPVAQPKPKPQPVREVQPKPKLDPKPIQKAQVKPPPQQPSAAAVGRENAFVPPSSTAAYLRNPKPTYPAIAQRRGMQGLVLLFVLVSAQGEALSVTVKESSGYVLLDKAAVKAVSAWRFSPAQRGGMPVAAGVEVPVRFILNDV